MKTKSMSAQVGMRGAGLLLVLWLSASVLFGQKTFVGSASLPSGKQTRLLVLTDIEADPDDAQSLVRLLLYANQLAIEGLIATTSIHQKSRVAPETIHRIVDAYGKVQPNLLKHEPGFPAAQALTSCIKKGLPVYGMAGVGEGHDSEGSEWLIKVLDKPDNRPLWVSVWGGPNTLAQALWKIRATRSSEQAGRLYRKLRVYTISDQDDSGPWIRKNFPTVFYICSPGFGYEQATWRGINTSEPGTFAAYADNDWLARHIQQGHGPLGAVYPDVAYGMEGDTPAFLGLIPNGLNQPERPDYGGWGGRYTFYRPTGLPPRHASGQPVHPPTNPKPARSGPMPPTRLSIPRPRPSVRNHRQRLTRLTVGEARTRRYGVGDGNFNTTLPPE